MHLVLFWFLLYCLLCLRSYAQFARADPQAYGYSSRGIPVYSLSGDSLFDRVGQAGYYTAIFSGPGNTPDKIADCVAPNGGALACDIDGLFDSDDINYYRLEIFPDNIILLNLVRIHAESYEIYAFLQESQLSDSNSIVDIDGGVRLTLVLTGDVFEAPFAIVRFTSPKGIKDIEGTIWSDNMGGIFVSCISPPYETAESYDIACRNPSGSTNSSCLLLVNMSVSLDTRFFSPEYQLTLGYVPPKRIGFIYPGVTADLTTTYRFNLGRVKVEDLAGATVDLSNIFENVQEGEAKYEKITNITEDETISPYLEDNSPNPDFPAFDLIRTLCSEGYDLIITCSYRYQRQTIYASNDHKCENSSTKFVNIGGVSTNAKTSAAFVKAYQMRYLNGIVAGEDLKERKIAFQRENPLSNYSRNCVGFIASIPTPSVQREINAFAIGCRESYDDCIVKVLWIGSSINDQVQRDAAAFLWNVGKCDILTHNTDSIEPQIYYAKKGGSILGYNADNRAIVGDAILTSALINWDAVYIYFITKIKEENWQEELYFPGAAEGAVDLALFSPRVSPSTRELVENIKEDLESMSQTEAFGAIFCGPLRANWWYKKDEDGRALRKESGSPIWEKVSTPIQINSKHYINIETLLMGPGSNITDKDCLWGSERTMAGEALIGDAFPEPFDPDRVFNDYLLEGVELFEDIDTIYGKVVTTGESTNDEFAFIPPNEYPYCDGTQWTRIRAPCNIRTLTTPIEYSYLETNGENVSCGLEVNNETGKIQEVAPLPYIASTDLNAPICDYVPFESTIGIVNISVIGVSVLIQVAILAILIHYRKHRTVASTQPSILGLITLMSICLNLSLLLFLGQPTELICVARIWTTNLFFDLMFTLLWAKLFRIYTVYSYARKMKKAKMTTRESIAVAGYLSALDLGIIIAWTIIDRPSVGATKLTLDIPDGIGEIEALECNSSGVFRSIAIFYKILIIGSACYLVFLLRNIPERLFDFVPFKAVLISSYNTAVILGLVFLLTSVLSDVVIKHSAYIICGAYGTLVIVFALTLPSLLKVQSPPNHSNLEKENSFHVTYNTSNVTNLEKENSMIYQMSIFASPRPSSDVLEEET